MNRSWKIYWVWVAATIALYVALAGWAGPKISSMASGLAPFDLRTTGYSLADGTQLINELTAEGSAFYLDVWYPLDMTFLSFITVAMAVGLWALYRRFHRVITLIAVLLPMAYGVADVLENNAVAGLVRGGISELTPALVEGSSQFTQVKFVFFFASVAMILIGLAARFMRRRKAV